MAVQGVDYSSARPDPACLYREGKRFAIRYTHLGTPRPKAITLAEATRLTNAGLRLVTVFEETAGGMLGGAAAGKRDAEASWTMGKTVGMHPLAPHYFALDVDPTPFTAGQWLACAAYLDAAAAVLGRHRVGLYGNDVAIDRLRNRCSWYWQTYAWSGGRWTTGLHLRQYKNGVVLCGGEVDLNDALTPYYGQWGVHVAMASDLQRAQDFARSCDPIPYRMSVEIGRDGIDCSGFMSAIVNSLMNKANPFVRLFATGTIRDLVAAGKLPMLHPGLGDSGDFNLGVVYPWEMSSGIGHMAGTLGGLNVESRGGDGVVIGSAARGATHSLFKHHFHMKIDNTGNVEGDDMPLSDTDKEWLKTNIATPMAVFDRLALWIAGRANRVFNPSGIAGRLGAETDFETPVTRAEFMALDDKVNAIKAKLDSLGSAPGGGVTKAEVEEVVRSVFGDAGTAG